MTIEVQPAPDQRRPFAAWAHGHSARTQSAHSFAIGPDLFPLIPDVLLAGAVVEGQPWVGDDLTGSAAPVSESPIPAKRRSAQSKES